MKKNYLFPLLAIGMMAALMTGCRTTTVVTVVEEPFPVNAMGENLQALTKITESENPCDYSFGGDKGRNLFFTVHEKDSRNLEWSNIFKKDNPLSSPFSQKTGGKNKNMAPTFCAATDKLAFAGLQEGAQYHDIYMINASQGNAQTQITNTPNRDENYPCLSRDGKRIVYESRLVTARYVDTEIWSHNLVTHENQQLSQGRMPSFSADGRSIVFVQYSDDGTSTSLWTMNADGSNKQRITDAAMGTIWHPRFSPDGRRIVFHCIKPQKNDADLYVVDRNGNNITQLTFNKSYDGEPYWADDGNIYFTSDRGGQPKHYQIWRVRYGGTSTGPIVNIDEEPDKPVISTPGTTHKVAYGENITQVAARYGVTVADIVRWNGLRSMTLTPGMTLKVSAQ